MANQPERMKTSDLSDLVDSAAERLTHSLGFDITETTGLGILNNLKSKIQECYDHYIHVSKILSNKLLLSAGAVEESNIERRRRTQLHSEYYAAMKAIRLTRRFQGEEVTSEWDINSVRSASPSEINPTVSTSTHLSTQNVSWHNYDESSTVMSTAAPVYSTSNSLFTESRPTYSQANSLLKPSSFVQSSYNNDSFVTVDDIISPYIQPHLNANFVHSSFKPIHKVKFSHASINQLEDPFQKCSLDDNRPQQQTPPTSPVHQSYGYNATPQSHTRMRNVSTPPLNEYRHQQPQGFYQAPLQPVTQTSADYHLRRLELFKASAHPFSGEPQRFFAWKSLLENELKQVNLNSIDTVKVLMANTTGEPLSIIKDLFNAGAAQPDIALRNIWKALHRQFGTSSQVASALQRKIDEFPRVKLMSEGKRLRELLHICHLINSYMNSCQDLQLYNLPAGIRKVWLKLPDSIQNRWRTFAHDYEDRNNNIGPSFLDFASFLERQVSEVCNPNYERSHDYVSGTIKKRVLATGTLPDSELASESNLQSREFESQKSQNCKCPIHSTDSHSLLQCRRFEKLSYEDKRKILVENRLCFRCALKHHARECEANLSCDKCNGKHNTALHNDNYKPQLKKADFRKNDKTDDGQAKNMCTSLCNDPLQGKNCSKTVLVELTLPSISDKKMTTYAILDDQSTTSFVDPRVIQFFDAPAKPYTYTLVTLLGLKSHVEGQIIDGFEVRGIKEKKGFKLPPLVSNDSIPDTKKEVASPSIVGSHPHLKGLSKNFCNVHQSAEVTLLIGRDCADILSIKCYGDKAPFAYQTKLGWSLVGCACPNMSPQPSSSCLKTSIEHEHFLVAPNHSPDSSIKRPSLLEDVFDERPDDELKCYSEEEKTFNDMMQSSVAINDKGHITMPLPFKNPNPSLPDNSKAVYHRTNNTLQRLKKDKAKLDDCLTIMRKNLDAHHVEEVPADELVPTRGKAWWLPIFPVTHPKKLKHRLVFDASASFQGSSLNDHLLKGPDENNLLKGVLLRFRKGPVAFSSDVEAMFHQFHVDPTDCNFLRFYWFDKNSPELELVQYRARVHIFGNRPSPAIANFGLRHATKLSNACQYPEAQRFICNNIYVDDGLGSAPTATEAIKILRDARTILKTVGINLHKIASNSADVLNAFPKADLAPHSHSVELNDSETHGTLGVRWDTASDKFLFSVNVPDRPYTRRGVLSTVNSLFDPLKVAVPIILTGRLLQRALLKQSNNSSWDEPLDPVLLTEWNEWRQSLGELKDLSLPRSFMPKGFGMPVRSEVHTFCDASRVAVAYVAYLKLINSSDEIHVSFICACSKLSPKTTSSIPRLELCSAVEATIGTTEIIKELQMPIDQVYMYSDSTVVLGYISNTTKNFSNYVSRRVRLIKKSFPAEFWHYVPTDINTADIATRGTDTKSLLQTRWLSGPTFLWEHAPVSFTITIPELPEVIEQERALTSHEKAVQQGVFSEVLAKFSDWNKVKRIAQHVVNFIYKLKTRLFINERKVFSQNNSPNDIEVPIIIDVQNEYFGSLKTCLLKGEDILDKTLASLCPFISTDGMIRVGGRLKHAPIPYDQRHPVLIPTHSPLTRLVILHHHKMSQHQGRLITSSAIRSAGFFILKGSKKIRQIINHCILCRKLRRPTEVQKMSDLPSQRLEDHPPFTYSGLDVCGPFIIANGRSTRKCRGSLKIWALLITCMVSRGVHIEPLPSLDVTAFKNAYRRFLSIRGHCKKLYSDRGTNFVGAVSVSNEFDFQNLQRDIQEQGTEWIMNPPHASHFGGAWERKVGSLKRILDATLSQLGPRSLSYDEFVTLLSEASCIINNTPLTGIYSDPNEPFPITPALLLTQKSISNPPPLESYSPQDILAYGKRRYRRVQHLSDYFWNKWRCDYLANQASRRKWFTSRDTVKVGDLVMLKNKNVKRNKWPLGMIRSVKISDDDLVRSAIVDIIDENGVKRSYLRPIVDLVLLAPHDS